MRAQNKTARPPEEFRSGPDGFPVYELQTKVQETGWAVSFVQLRSHSGQRYPMAEAFEKEITKLYEAREQKREARQSITSLKTLGRRAPDGIELQDGCVLFRWFHGVFA